MRTTKLLKISAFELGVALLVLSIKHLILISHIFKLYIINKIIQIIFIVNLWLSNSGVRVCNGGSGGKWSGLLYGHRTAAGAVCWHHSLAQTQHKPRPHVPAMGLWTCALNSIKSNPIPYSMQMTFPFQWFRSTRWTWVATSSWTSRTTSISSASTSRANPYQKRRKKVRSFSCFSSAFRTLLRHQHSIYTAI